MRHLCSQHPFQHCTRATSASLLPIQASKAVLLLEVQYSRVDYRARCFMMLTLLRVHQQASVELWQCMTWPACIQKHTHSTRAARVLSAACAGTPQTPTSSAAQPMRAGCKSLTSEQRTPSKAGSYPAICSHTSGWTITALLVATVMVTSNSSTLGSSAWQGTQGHSTASYPSLTPPVHHPQ